MKNYPTVCEFFFQPQLPSPLFIVLEPTIWSSPAGGRTISIAACTWLLPRKFWFFTFSLLHHVVPPISPYSPCFTLPTCMKPVLIDCCLKQWSTSTNRINVHITYRVPRSYREKRDETKHHSHCTPAFPPKLQQYTLFLFSHHNNNTQYITSEPSPNDVTLCHFPHRLITIVSV